MEPRELYRIAEIMTGRAYAPYSGFCVGAALLTKSGQVFTGVNVESAAYGATVCAERTAICKAVSEGYRDFEAIAIASSAGEAWPCGVCRQLLYEFGEDTVVITGPDSDHLQSRTIKELLPEGFRL